MAEPTTPRRPLPSAGEAGSLASPSRHTAPTTPAAYNLTEDMDHPTSTPTAYRPSASVPSPGGGGADDSGDEDDAPDYLRLLSSLNPRSKTAGSANTANIVIPKRGEKDFEPTGFGGQAKLLEQSREAMYQAVSGERTVGSRSLVKATWVPQTRRARLHDVQGKIFETVGIIRRTTEVDQQTGKTHTKATNELLPEEALFLAERASLQIYQQSQSGALEPMSLQQAFTLLMLPSTEGKTEGNKKVEDEGLTREAYLIYAYLKRLGYVVQRANLVDKVRAAPVSAAALARKNHSSSQSQPHPDTAAAKAAAAAKGIIADPQRPIRLVTIWDILLYIPRRISQLAADAARQVASWLHRLYVQTIGRLGGSRTQNVASLGLGLGLDSKGKTEDGRRFLGDKGNVAWDSYDAVFSSLQIVPSGHDSWLPTTTTTATSSSSSALTTSSSIQHAPGSSALAPFYYAWRPATVYRKSHPPAPEFRIVILNARTHALPSLRDFQSLFSHIPIPGSDAELFGTVINDPHGAYKAEDQAVGMSQEAWRQRLEYEKALKASNDAKNRAAYGKFSQGKQKFLRERAEARREASASAGQKRSTLSASLMWRKVVRLDAAWLTTVARLFTHCPGCCSADAHANRAKKWTKSNSAQGRPPVRNVFAPLKAGRRSVVVAVVDGSITTLLRFGEAEFNQWALYGFKPQPQPQPQAQQQS